MVRAVLLGWVLEMIGCVFLIWASEGGWKRVDRPALFFALRTLVLLGVVVVAITALLEAWWR